MWGSYLLIEVVEIIENDDCEVEPHQCEEEDEEEEKEPAAVALKAKVTAMHTPAGHPAHSPAARCTSRHCAQGCGHGAVPGRGKRASRESSSGQTHAPGSWSRAGEDSPWARTASCAACGALSPFRGAAQCLHFGHEKRQSPRCCGGCSVGEAESCCVPELPLQRGTCRLLLLAQLKPGSYSGSPVPEYLGR